MAPPQEQTLFTLFSVPEENTGTGSSPKLLISHSLLASPVSPLNRSFCLLVVFYREGVKMHEVFVNSHQ